MSSWVAIRRRIDFQQGQKVLVLGATGNSGQMAVQIAKLLGASQVIAAGRDENRLNSLTKLGADATVSLAGEPEEATNQLGKIASRSRRGDRLFVGKPAELTMLPLLMNRSDRSRALY